MELAVEFIACVYGLPGITEQFHGVLRTQWTKHGHPLVVGANLGIMCTILIVVRHYTTVIAHAHHHGTIQLCMDVVVRARTYIA